MSVKKSPSEIRKIIAAQSEESPKTAKKRRPISPFLAQRQKTMKRTSASASLMCRELMLRRTENQKEAKQHWKEFVRFQSDTDIYTPYLRKVAEQKIKKTCKYVRDDVLAGPIPKPRKSVKEFRASQHKAESKLTIDSTPRN